jgi:molybdate transport system substrate-binding protein
MRRSIALAFAVLAGVIGAPAWAAADELSVVASVAIKPAFDQLVPQFERASGHTIAVRYGAGVAVRKQIDAGEAFDVAIISPAAAADLTKTAVLLPEPQPVVGVTVAALAYKDGTPKPDIATEAAFKATVLAASGISLSDPSLGGASSNYFMAVIKRLGIDAAVQGKLVFTKPGYGAAPVAAGGAQYGAALTSEIAGVPGVSGVPIFPQDPAGATTLVAAVASKSAHADAARAFLAFLTTPAAAAVRKAKGLGQD